MSEIDGAVGAARYAHEVARFNNRDRDKSMKAAILAFLKHESVREPGDGRFMGRVDRGAMAVKGADDVAVLLASERVAAVRAAWPAMIDALIAELERET